MNLLKSVAQNKLKGLHSTLVVEYGVMFKFRISINLNGTNLLQTTLYVVS